MMMVMAGGARLELVESIFEQRRITDALLAQDRLKGREKSFVVSILRAWRVAALPRLYLIDQRIAEFIPSEESAIAQRVRHAEHPPLPRLVEYELSVSHGGRRGPLVLEAPTQYFVTRSLAHAGASSLSTPTMLSRVTSAMSSSSLMLSVPAGRSGNTMYRTSEEESHT